MTENDSNLDRQILAAALYNPEAVEVFKDSLNPESIGKPVQMFGYYQLYTAAVKCHSEIGDISPDVFDSWLQNYPEIYESLGGVKGYAELVGSLPDGSTANPLSLVKLAHKRLGRTQTIKKLNELQLKLNDDQIDDDSLENLAIEVQDRIRSTRPEQKFTLRTALEIAENADNLWEDLPFIPTQFRALNEALGYDKDTGGVLRSSILSIVATSGLGKSTLAKSLCNHWLDNGYRVLFINFEETQDWWERVLMTQITKENCLKPLPSHEASKLTKKFRSKMEEWGDRLMVRHDPDSLYYEDLEAWLKDLYHDHEDKRPDIVVIDTIQSLFTKSGGGARWGDFEYMMVRLEKLAKDMNAVFILTVQQNNNALREGRTTVNQSDVGGSVTIVQKSTVAMLLMPRREEIGLDTDWDSVPSSGIIEIHMPKNRITGAQSNNKPPLIQYEDETKTYYEYKGAATPPAKPMTFEID